MDFVHLLAYLYDAAQAWKKDPAAAWKQYEQWLRQAWAGQVKALLAGLRSAATQTGKPPKHAADDDPRRVIADTLGYVENNRTRMDYPPTGGWVCRSAALRSSRRSSRSTAG